MNYRPLEKGNTSITSEIINNRRIHNNIPIPDFNRGPSKGENKRISLTPDRRNSQSNSNRDIYNINNQNQKYNPRLIQRNYSSKKIENNYNSNLIDHQIINFKEKNSLKEISQISSNHDHSTISKFSNKSTVQGYLDRRHLETQQKINRLRHERLSQESTELKFKPVISENSKKIVKNLITKENAVKIFNHNPILLGNKENKNTVENNVDFEYKKNLYNNHNNNNYNNNTTYSKQKSVSKEKFSQFEDYKKIAEKRENLNLNFQKHTIDVNLIK